MRRNYCSSFREKGSFDAGAGGRARTVQPPFSKGHRPSLTSNIYGTGGSEVLFSRYQADQRGQYPT